MRTRQLLRTLCFALALLASGNVLATTETYDFKTFASSLSGSGENYPTYSGDKIWSAPNGTGWIDVKVMSYSGIDLGGRIAADVRTSNGFNFRNTSGWIGLNSGYNAERYLSILNLKVGDKVTVTFNQGKLYTYTRDNLLGGGTISETLTNNELSSGVSYTMATAGRLDLVTGTSKANIEKIVIEPYTDPTGDYGTWLFTNFSSDHNHTGTTQTGSLYYLASSESGRTLNKFAVSRSGSGESGFKFVKDKYLQIYWTREFAILNLSNGDHITLDFETVNSQTFSFKDFPTSTELYYLDNEVYKKVEANEAAVSGREYIVKTSTTSTAITLTTTVNTQTASVNLKSITIAQGSAPIFRYGTFTFTGLGTSGGTKPDWGERPNSEDLYMLKLGNEVFGNRFACGTILHNSSDNCFKFKTNGEWDGLFTEYEDRTLSIRDLEIGNKITITCKADRAQLKFNDDTPNVVKEDGSPVSKDDIIENGSVYYVTAAGNLNLKSYRITDGNRQTYIQSITIEKGNGTVPTSETVGNPTIQQTGNTVTITPGVSSKEGSVKLLVSTSDADPTEVSLTDGKYTIDLSAEGNTGITTITAKTVSATTSTIASESVSYTVLAKPTIAYSAKNTITITGTSGSTIHYTTGEEAPTASSTAYSEALTYTEAATIKAIIAKDGNTSDVATFSLIPITADPTFANASVGDAKKVTITPATTTETSCTTFWSTDGNDPSTAESNENKFTESTKTIDIPEGCTIVKAITVTEAGNISSVASYNVPGTLTAPTITAASAISESGVTNTITITAEEGATIYHTTDGVAPTTESTSYTAALTQNTSATIKAIAVKDGATSSVATFEFKAIATAPTMERKGNHVIITAGATDGETNTATTTYQIGEGEEAAYSEPIVLTEANTTIKAITSTTSGNKIEVSQTFETVESVSTPSITISDKGIATITAGTSNLTGATVKTYYVTGEGDPTTVYDETNKPQLTDGQSIKAISVSEYDPSEYNVKSETASMTYTAPIPEAEGTKYDFTLYGDANGVLPTYGSDVTSGDQSLQMLAAGDNTFDNRFAVGLKRGDDAVFKFRNSDSYKGLYSQYDKRYLSILNLKAGDEVTVYMHAERAALTFSGTPIVSNASAGESVGNGTTYTVTSKGNLDFVTTGETYIEKIIINSEEVNAPSIVQTGDKVTITAGTVTPSYDGVKVKYTFAAEGEPDTEAASGAAIDIPANATVVSAVTVGKRSNSDKTSLTLLAKPEITAYTEGDAKNTIQIANANYYSTNYDGATALTISEGKPSGNGTWNAVTDGGIINTLTASSTVYAVKVDGNNISPVSAVYNFTYDTSVLPNAAAPTITASDNKVTITTIEEGATTTYYLGTETTGTTLETTSVTLEDLTASTTIKAVSAIEGKQDATTNFTFTYISTLPTITQGASSNEVAITIGNATLGEGEIITTTYQIGDAAAVGITENKTLTDLTADDNNKVITVTTTVTKDNTVTNSASVTLTFAYVAPVSDGKIDVTYDFTGFADKTNFTQADPLATADSDFDNRFAVSRITSDAGFWLRSYSDKTKGLYSRYADRTLTVKNLTAGDKVTINWHCDDSQNSDNDGKFVLTDGTDVVSGSPIVIAEDGDLTIKSAKGGTKDPCVTITSIIIHEAETLSAPTIAVNPENSNEVIITAGKTNNADATITTYYAITTDDTDPVPTTESTTNFTGSGAKETITLTQSIKIKAISVSSTESMDEQASEVKEFTYVAETLTAPTIKLALADNSVVITAGQSNNEEATVTTYYSLNGEAPTISETNEQKFTGESKELTLEADATIIAVSVSSTGKAANATSETFTFTYDAPDGKTRFNTTYDFTGKDGNPINQDAEHKVTSNGTSLFLLAYDENTNFDNRFAIGPDSRTGNGGFYFRNNNATYKGLFTGYDSRNFSVLNLKKGDKVTLTLSNNAETLKFVEGDVVLSGKAYTAKADGNMDFVTLTGGVYIEKVVIAEAEAVQAPTLTLSEDGTKVTIAAGASNNPEAIVSTYYTTTGSISFNDGKAVTEGLTKLTADNSVVTVVGTTNIEAIAISNGGAESIVTKGSYVEPVVESDSKTYSFIGYGDQTGVIPAYATETTSGGQTLYLLATGDEIFDNRFAVGPKREDANVFKFREDGIYKGLYSQYDKRYFSILDLKKGEKVTLTINGNAETLQFADAAKVLEMTGGANAAKVAEGAKVKSGTTYYINEDGNLDFVTTGSIYIESAKISVAVEDEELTVAETVSKPTITDNGDNTVSITAGVSDADKKVTTYYTTDGSVPTAESAEYKEALALTADCTVKAITISEQGTKSEVAELAFTYVAPVEGLESYDFVVAEAGQTAAPTFGNTVEGTDLQMLAYGTKTFGNRFAVGPTSRNDGTNGGFIFRTSGDYKGLWSQYADRNFSILNLKQGDKVTITISKEAATLKFSDASKALEITSATDNTAAKLAEGATAKSGTAYYITGDCNLDFVTTGGVYIESVKIEEAAEGDTAPTIAETVSKPTVAQQGNSVTIVSGESTLGNSVTTYYTTDGTIPTVSSTKYTGAFALTADCTVKAITISELGTKSEVEELAFTYIEPKHQNGYGLYEFTGFAGTDAVTPDYDENGQLKIGAEDFDGRFACGPSNRIEDGSSFKFREAGDYKGLWSQYGDRTLTIKGLKASDSFVISGAQVSLKLTGTSIVANMESGDAIEDGVQYFTSNDGDVELITTGSTYIESIEILNGDGTLPELVSKPTMRQLQGVYNTVRLVPGRSSRGGASVATYYTTDGSEPTAEAKKVITTRNIKVPEGTQSVKAITISSTGQQSSVVEVAVSYMTPVDNGEPYNFVGYGSTGGTKPDWGSEVTIGERKMQTVSIGTENFNERFAAGPKRDDGSMMMFRDNGDYKGLWTAYADRYFSVLNLKKGDKVVLILNEKAANLQLVDGDAVVSGQEYTVGAKGSLDFVTTEGGVYIESVVIINDGEDEAETEPEPSTDPDPETPSDQTTTNYGFAEYGDATGVVPDWGETITSGGEQLSMLAIDEENFDNRLACGPVRTDDKVFKFRNSGDYKGLYSQYADRYLSILNLKDGDMVTISMHPKAANLAFRGTPAVSNGMSNVQLRRGMRAARAASAGDMVESGATYVISTSDSSVNLDFVTTGSTYISSISIVSSSEATGIKVLKNLEDEGELRIFDLMGRRVTTPVKGKLYIVNGRKMIYK